MLVTSRLNVGKRLLSNARVVTLPTVGVCGRSVRSLRIASAGKAKDDDVFPVTRVITNRADGVERNFRRNPTLEYYKRKGDGNVTNYTIGEDAFNAPTETGGSNDADWTKLNSGMSYKVRLFKNYTQAVMKFRNYGIYKVINSFSAKNPSTKDSRGFAESNLTPWDKASQYYAELLFKAMDDKNAADEKKYKIEASKYREKERYAVAFGDLDTGLPVHFDISPKQWAGIRTVITKYKANLDTLAFEIAKSGSGTATVVSFMPIMTQFDPLTDKQQANFDKFNDFEFDAETFKGFIYEVDEATQIQFLVQAGFDISLIGLEAPKQSEGNPVDNTQAIDETELPF